MTITRCPYYVLRQWHRRAFRAIVLKLTAITPLVSDLLLGLVDQTIPSPVNGEGRGGHKGPIELREPRDIRDDSATVSWPQLAG